MNYIRLFFLIMTIIPAIFASAAAQVPGREGVFSRDGKKPDTIHMTAEKLTYDHKSKIVRLIDNVKITYGESIMTSQKAEFNGETKIGHFTGGVKLWQPGNVLTGDTMDAYYAEKRGVLRGHVRAIMEEKKPGKDDEGPVVMTCEEIEFFWETKDAVAKRNVKIWRKDKTAYADTVHYSQSASLVTMSGNVRFERDEKDWLTCPEAYLDLKTNTFVARGGVEGNMVMEEEKKKKGEEPQEADRMLVPGLPSVQDDDFILDIPAEFTPVREEQIFPMPERSPGRKP
jgi:lipopolysaccharide assembly outer membrane protein LptD (OstA)